MHPLAGETPSYPTPGAFGRFEVLHQIGAGTLGPVFLARDPERARSVALKVFQLDITTEQAAELASGLVQLSRANLAHPSIVVPFDAGLAGGTAYMALDYFAADSLDSAIRQYGPPPVTQALRILSAVAGALDFAAVAGVQHGALHPRDLLVTPDDTHVTGLGIARVLETIGLRAPMRRPYVAPERVQRETWDGRADIYSLAVLARELLVGRSRGAEPAESRLPDDQAARLQLVLNKAMAARPAERYSSSLELMSAVQDALVPAAAGAVAAPRGERVARDSHDLLLPLEAEPETPQVEQRPPEEIRLLLHGEPEQATPEDLPVIDAPNPTFAGDDDAAGLELESRADERAVADIDLSDLDNLAPERASAAADAAAEDEADMAVPPIESAAETEHGTLGLGGASIGDEMRTARERFEAALGRLEEPEPIQPDRERAAVQPQAATPRPSRVLPLALMLLVGVIIGAVAGYLVGPRLVPPQSTPATPPPASDQGGGTPPAPASVSQQPAAVQPPARSPAGDSATAVPTDSAPTASSKRASANRTLYVRSNPRGASVTVNGRPRGVTPLRLRGLTPGRYTVRVARNGYEAEEREVVVSADRTISSVLFSLDRVAAGTPASTRAADFYGTLSVDSLPAGARVFVDGRLLGTTPLAAARVAAGSHVVRVDRTGYLPWTSPIQVVSGKPLRVTASLEREPR